LHFQEVVRFGRLALTPPLRAGSSPADLTTASPGGSIKKATRMSIRTRTPEFKPAMLTVTDGTTTVGFILSRGPRGFEAFDHGGKSLGIFETQKQAVCAIPRRAKDARDASWVQLIRSRDGLSSCPMIDASAAAMSPLSNGTGNWIAEAVAGAAAF
jgi:hypothetical protein